MDWHSLITKLVRMGAGKKMTLDLGEKGLVMGLLGIILFKQFDVSAGVDVLSKLPQVIPLVEQHAKELKDLRLDVERIKAALLRNKIVITSPDDTDLSTAIWE